MIFIQGGVERVLTEQEKRWFGGKGSFILNGADVAGGVTLLADFGVGAGPQVIDSDLTLSAIGVINFELPAGVKLSIDNQAATVTHCEARPLPKGK